MHTMNAARPPALVAFRLYMGRAWLVSLVAAADMLLVTGTVTAIIENPFFTRMTPVRSVDYPVWVLSALLFGLVIGSFTIPLPGQHEGKLSWGATLSFLAVGCAVCNKPVVLLLGASGALTFFAPAPVLLGLASVALLGWTLRLRLNALSASCPLA